MRERKGVWWRKGRKGRKERKREEEGVAVVLEEERAMICNGVEEVWLEEGKKGKKREEEGEGRDGNGIGEGGRQWCVMVYISGKW